MAPAQSEHDGYVLARTSDEYRRLVLQARLWAEATDRALAKAGLGPGMRALDIGCGPGEVMRAMGRLVGPGGSVTGVDIDTAIGGEALAVLNAEGPPIYHFEHFDLTSDQEAPGAPYDLVFARLVVFHMADQPGALRRLWRWVKPGGSLLIMEYDMARMRSYPPVPAIDEGRRLVEHGFTAAGRDIEIGLRVPGHFLTAGIGAPDGCETAGHIMNAAVVARMVSGVLASLRPAIERMGLADSAHLDAVFKDLASVSPDDGFGRSPDLTATWKRKPQAGS